MATQICPKCKVDSFNWKVDEEESPLTIWDCVNCQYRAFENESDERNCLKCGKKSESKLKDEKKEYWWCSSCNTTSVIKRTMDDRIKKDVAKFKKEKERIIKIAKKDPEKYKNDIYGNSKSGNEKSAE